MEILVVIILTLINGFFALAEIALVSVKKSRIEHLASQGSARAKDILRLMENPENFLSSVQVGITLIGIIAGAYGGATLTVDLENVLASFTLLHPYTYNISLVIVIGGITYFTIVIGELVPKSIAMNNAEKIAMICVPVIKYFTMAAYPFVKLLSVSTQIILKIVGVNENKSENTSEEELRYILKVAGKQGVLETEESQVHQNLFYFTDQTAKSLMTRSSEVEWINYNHDKQTIFKQLEESVHSKFVVGDGSIEKVKGVITIKDFFENYNAENFKLDDVISIPVYIAESTPAFKILNIFKREKQYIGVVIDEFQFIKGIVTLHDLFEAIVGNLPDEDETDELNIFKRADGSFLIKGSAPIYEINQYFQQVIIEDNTHHYTTISGFILNQLQTIPNVGAVVNHGNFQFEIMDMDGVRIDKILMVRIK
ncbi:MAG: HlyC/CorC family transporter [Bacteroidetes bacterium]|nr:HlyC/CorC family transporter [Bacteroidota bacterium]